MILVLIHYDPKFIEPVCNLFRQAADDVLFVVEAPPRQDVTHIPLDIHAVARTPKEFRQILRSRSDWDGVVVQCMSPGMMKLLREVPSSIPIAWKIWGFEAYSYWPALAGSLYQPLTKEFVCRQMDPQWKRRLRPWFYLLSGKLAEFSRVRLFLSVFKEEYDLLRKVGLLSSKVEFCWCSPGLSAPAKVPDAPLGHDILLGNSASPENNHVDAFVKLARMGLKGRSVIVPLSYGNMKYRDWVLQEGKRMLGQAFVPLLDFLPKAEYFSILQRCGITLMNHMRQQALGNIFMQLRMGSNVYLNDTPVCRGLQRNGFSVARLDHALTGGENSPGVVPLTEAAAAHNRELVAQLYGPEKLIQAARDVMTRLHSIRKGG